MRINLVTAVVLCVIFSEVDAHQGAPGMGEMDPKIQHMMVKLMQDPKAQRDALRKILPKTDVAALTEEELDEIIKEDTLGIFSGYLRLHTPDNPDFEKDIVERMLQLSPSMKKEAILASQLYVMALVGTFVGLMSGNGGQQPADHQPMPHQPPRVGSYLLLPVEFADQCLQESRKGLEMFKVTIDENAMLFALTVASQNKLKELYAAYQAQFLSLEKAIAHARKDKVKASVLDGTTMTEQHFVSDYMRDVTKEAILRAMARRAIESGVAHLPPDQRKELLDSEQPVSEILKSVLRDRGNLEAEARKQFAGVMNKPGYVVMPWQQFQRMQEMPKKIVDAVSEQYNNS